jgi:hypothetical protein
MLRITSRKQDSGRNATNPKVPTRCLHHAHGALKDKLETDGNRPPDPRPKTPFDRRSHPPRHPPAAGSLFLREPGGLCVRITWNDVRTFNFEGRLDGRMTAAGRQSN